MTTFADLGIPFPLFEAPVDEASGYVGLGRCSLCGTGGRHCFELGIGDAVVAVCGFCGSENGLDADDRAAAPCFNCRTIVPFPNGLPEQILTCYECLRSGKAAIGKDTVLGMVGWEQANRGLTHGMPGLHHPDFPMVRVEEEDDWYAARVNKSVLFELLRHPSYPTWQVEAWQFCHAQPMVYIGTWAQRDFEQHALSGDGRALFMQSVADAQDDLWEDGRMAASITTYIFRCAICGGYKGHWDVD